MAARRRCATNVAHCHNGDHLSRGGQGRTLYTMNRRSVVRQKPLRGIDLLGRPGPAGLYKLSAPVHLLVHRSWDDPRCDNVPRFCHNASWLPFWQSSLRQDLPNSIAHGFRTAILAGFPGPGLAEQSLSARLRRKSAPRPRHHSPSGGVPCP